MRMKTWLLMGSLIGACSGERSEGTPSEDAATQSTLDGGGTPGDGLDGGTRADAGEDALDGDVVSMDAGDAAPEPSDASMPNPGTGFAVTVRSQGVPRQGLQVLLHDEEGKTIAQLTTNADGVASSDLAPSIMTVSTLPVILPGFVGVPITYFGLTAGDRVEIELESFAEPTQLGSYSVRHSGDEGFPAADSYNVVAGDVQCSTYTNDPSMAANVQLTSACARPPQALLSTAYDPDGFPLAYAATKGVALPSGSAPLEVTLDPFVAAEDSVVRGLNIPSDLTESRVELQMLIGGSLFWGGEGDGAPLATGSSFPVATDFADAFQVSAAALVETSALTSLGFVSRLPPATMIDLDFSNALPRLTSAELTSSATSKVVTFSSSAPVAAADVGVVTLAWTQQSGETMDVVSVLLIIPPTLTSFTLPSYPAGMTAIPEEAKLARVLLVDDSTISGFSDFKTKPLRPRSEAIDPYTNQLELYLAPTGTDGQLRLTAWTDSF